MPFAVRPVSPPCQGAAPRGSPGRVPVVAQTGATGEAVELSRHAQAAGASVLMVVTPYYEPLTLDETLRYLRTVADAVDIRIVVTHRVAWGAGGGTVFSGRDPGPLPSLHAGVMCLYG